MKNKFPKYASKEQSAKIWNLIRGYEVNAPDSVVQAQVGDIFTYLPHSITYNGKRGDLSVSPIDIAYFSVGGEWKHVLVHFEGIGMNEDIFDTFIKMLTWLKENNLM